MLRDYQQKAIEDILSSFNKNDSVMLQMPTGTGKTTVFAELIRIWIKEINSGQRVLVLVHRKELVDQALARIKQFGILAARIQSGFAIALEKQVQVGMVQSLKNKSRLPKNLSLIIIDEAHHTPAKSYRDILKNYTDKNVKILGVTATPCRTNGEGFKDLYQKLITSDSISTFIEKEHLAKIRHLAFAIPDLSKIKINKMTKDYDEKGLELIVRDDKVIADLIESYIKHAENKKAIVFAVNKAHSKDIVKRFSEKNVPAAYIDADTKKEDRDKIVEEFKAGIYKVLCNVNIFTEGFDCPDIEVVMLARPTKSFSLYLQQVGRVMRPFPGKEHGLILDNASLWSEHGLVTKDMNWTLEDGVIIEEIEKEKLIKNEYNEIVESNIPDEIKGLDAVELAFTELSDENIPKENLEFSYEELVYLFYRLISHGKNYIDLLTENKRHFIMLDQKYNYSNQIFNLNGIDLSKILYAIGIIKDINQKKLNINKIYNYVNEIKIIDKRDFNEDRLLSSYYQYLKNEALNENNNIDKHELISKFFRNESIYKDVRKQNIEMIYNMLYEENGDLNPALIKKINEFSNNKYLIYASIIKKLNIEEFNTEECLIFE
jgi:superfamily II DNA or RNA helicase